MNPHEPSPGSDHDPTSASVPLLKHANFGPAFDQHLRRSLMVLRDQATDTKVRDRINDVLAGRLTLRELASDGGFGAMMEPLVDKGLSRVQDLTPDEDARARQGAAAMSQGKDPLAAMGFTKEELAAAQPAGATATADPSEDQAETPPPPTYGTW